jgi:hypothetical protein
LPATARGGSRFEAAYFVRSSPLGWVLASLARFDRSLADNMRVCSLLSARWPAIHWLAASMQMGVEIHLHQGKPGVRAANTHRVAQTLLCG